MLPDGGDVLDVGEGGRGGHQGWVHHTAVHATTEAQKQI